MGTCVRVGGHFLGYIRGKGIHLRQVVIDLKRV